jgi:diacylglycerol kinase
MKKIAKAIHDYIKDWKNLLFHTITGVVILIVAIYLPVSIYIRIGILILVVLFNIFRKKFK